MSSERIFNAPRIVLGMLTLLIAVHVTRMLLLSPDLDDWLVLATAFIPARFDDIGVEFPGGEGARFWSWISYMLIHGDLMHLTFNSVWLLVFGTAIAPRLGSFRFVLFTLATGALAAAGFLATNPHLFSPVVGASGAISAHMGATMRLMFPAIDAGGLVLLQIAPQSVPMFSMREALADTRVQVTAGMFLVFNVLAALGIDASGASGPIAWEAHVAGFLAGFILIGIFDRTSAPQQPFMT